MAGDIQANSVSSIILNLTQNSSLNGAINNANTAKEVVLNMDIHSLWEVSGDSYLTVFTDEDQSLSNIKANGHTIYYNSSLSENNWLGGKTHQLPDGGKLEPVK